MLDAGNWLADQLLNRSLASWVLLMLCARAAIQCRAAPRPAPDAARQLLWCWGLVPLAFMPIVGLAAGSRLHLPWGTPFLLFAIPAVMELLRPRCTWDRVPLRPALGWFILLQAALLLASLLSSPKGPAGLRDQHWRAFDSAGLARTLEPALQARLGGTPLCVVSGPGALAGALALHRADHPLVLIDGRPDQSPWVDARALANCPRLELRQDAPQTGDTPVGPAFPGLTWQLHWPRKAP